jgi:CubicO group peptidase (beta-lactamase class C family)
MSKRPAPAGARDREEIVVGRRIPQMLVAFAVVALAFVEMTGPSLGQELPADRVVARRIDAYLKGVEAHGHFSGAVRIMREGRLILDQAYGLANDEHGVRVSPHTRFRIGSIAKPMTATAILRLAQSEKLRLDDPIAKYVAGVPGGDTITLHHLLSHTSGLPRDSFNRSFFASDEPRHPFTDEELLAKIGAMKLLFAPGENWAYSNTGYWLLGRVIEVVSGQTWEEALRDLVFTPAGMTATSLDDPERIVPGRASGYYIKSGSEGYASYLNVPYIYPPNARGHGGLLSTTDDLYRFDRAVHDGTLLEPLSVEKMFAKHGGTYGYGWNIYDLTVGPAYIATGRTAGFNSVLTHLESLDTTIVVLTNRFQVLADGIGETLVQIILGREYYQPAIRKEISVDPKLFARYVGTYIAGEFHFAIWAENDRLFFTSHKDPLKIELFPESETLFFAKLYDVRVDFLVDEEGKVPRAVWHHHDEQVLSQRVDDEPRIDL